MSLLGVVVSGVVTAILGGIALLSLAAAYDFFTRTYTGFVSATPASAVDDGLVKVCGTVEADRTLDPAVADTETVMSAITRYKQEGLSGKAMGSWEEDKELLRAVPFEVRDETGTVPIAHVEDPHRSGYSGLANEATVELEGGEAVPESVDAAFAEPSADVEAIVAELEGDGDEVPSELGGGPEPAGEGPREDDPGASAEEGFGTDGGTDPGSDIFENAGAGSDSGDVSSVLNADSPLRTGEPQKFEEQFAAPGDQVHVIGTAADGRITNESGTFQVRHEPRSKFELLKGVGGGVVLVLIGLGAGYGTVNWVQQFGRELLEVVAFIA